MSRGDEERDKTGGGVGARSGQQGSTNAEGSKMCPMRPLARISACTPSSQGKKSFLEVRTGMCETEGKVLERDTEVERKEGEGGEIGG